MERSGIGIRTSTRPKVRVVRSQFIVAGKQDYRFMLAAVLGTMGRADTLQWCERSEPADQRRPVQQAAGTPT
jgi:hypothetical protein